MFNHKDFSKLANYNADNCVTINIPTYRIGNQQEDKIRFKNALSDVLNELEERGFSKNEAHQFLHQGYELLDNDTFWSQQSDGLAVFIAPDVFEYFTVPVNLEKMAVVSDSFLLRPILPILQGENRFFLLALSQNQVRFFEGSQYSITPVMIDDLVPENMDEALALDEGSKTLQNHSGGNTPIFHGQGGEKDDKNVRLDQYFRMIDDGLMKMIHDERVPMIIAAVDYEVAQYKNISDYKHIVEEHISGNPESDDPVMLHEKAWSQLEDKFIAGKTEMKERFNAFIAEDKASFDVNDAIPAAINGRVATLFTCKGQHLWGKYDESKNQIEIHEQKKAESTCLINLAAIKTYQAGGDVYNLERTDMPRATANVNAIYRYNY